MFGFSKPFVIVLFISAFFSFGFRDFGVGLKIVFGYAIIKIIWNILSK